MTFYLNDAQKSLIKKHYRDYKVEKKDSSNYEELFQYKNIQIEIYKEKVIFSGAKETIIEEYRDYWKDFDTYESPIIGNAEYGIDDFFGPIVIISCYIGSGSLEKLRLLDISNYKDLSPPKFTELAQDIMKTIIFESVIINNRKYNQWIEAGYTPTIIKTWGQNQALVRMLQHKIQYDKIIIEEYINNKTYYTNIETMDANKNKIIYEKVEFIKNAQTKYLVVTCSTIISRYLFLEEIKKIKSINTTNIPYTEQEIKTFLHKIKKEKGHEYIKFIERHIKKNFMTKFHDLINN